MSEKALSLNQLNESARIYLEEILLKDVADLTAYEIGFIKARRAYLSAEQRLYLTNVLNGNIKGIDVEDNLPEVQTQPEPKVDKDGKRFINPDDFTRAVLIQMLRDAEIEFNPELNKQGLADLLNNR